MNEKRMIRRMQKKYFAESDGKYEDVYFSLDCYDKILYQAIHEYTDDCKRIFCNDINMGIILDPFVCYPVDLRIKDELFRVERFMPEEKEALSILENLVESGSVVGLCTMFDKLPPYCWYGQEDKVGKSNTHFSMIIGFDKENYYYVDDPSMLRPDAKMLAENHTVGIIEKKYLREALKEYCQILTVEVNDELLKEYDKFDLVKEKIVENYHKEMLFDGKKVFLGRNALTKFAEILKEDEYFEMIVSNFFWIYLMARKRKLFGQCLQEKNNKSNGREICKIIDQSCKEWEMLYYRVRAFVCGSGTAEQAKQHMWSRMNRIIETEDKLIETIRLLY